MTDLRAELNNIIRLPERLPAKLTRLEVPHNELTSLPEDLPATLKWLSTDSNELTHLPPNLPRGLEELSVRGNNLRGLGDGRTALPYILSQLPPHCKVYLNNNPLPDRLRAHLSAQSGTSLPQIFL